MGNAQDKASIDRRKASFLESRSGSMGGSEVRFKLAACIILCLWGKVFGRGSCFHSIDSRLATVSGVMIEGAMLAVQNVEDCLVFVFRASTEVSMSKPDA